MKSTIVKSCTKASSVKREFHNSPLADPYAVVPATGFVRIDQILKLIPVSKNTWWTGVREGIYPTGIKWGHRTTVWKAEDIHQLISELSEVK
ncbi:helix-turn-helix transcriptional regulator [Neptuniibacter sp. QD37_6]|uniref:helix-turn-helix transcriptional regulator n=1 Tax=Neptuniibacter sp. QD37_6 TaxID=3398210 RepID=UPI0039F4CBCD